LVLFAEMTQLKYNVNYVAILLFKNYIRKLLLPTQKIQIQWILRRSEWKQIFHTSTDIVVLWILWPWMLCIHIIIA